MTDVLGQAASGRYVIVQMDNGGDPMNLEEVKAFGRFTPQGGITKLSIIINSKCSDVNFIFYLSSSVLFFVVLCCTFQDIALEIEESTMNMFYLQHAKKTV